MIFFTLKQPDGPSEREEHISTLVVTQDTVWTAFCAGRGGGEQVRQRGAKLKKY